MIPRRKLADGGYVDPAYAAYMNKQLGVGQRYLPDPHTGVPTLTTPMANNLGGLASTSSGVPASITGSGTPGIPQTGLAKFFSKDNVNAAVSKTTSVLNEAQPFISNIVNAFRKPPMPKRGVPNQYVTLKPVNLDNERQGVRTQIAAANRATDRNVDGNTAEAVKAFNRGQEFENISKISERETNTNIGIGNQQAQLDLQVGSSNNAKTDKYRDELVERQIAQQRSQSENLANAGDKITMIKNEKEKAKVDLQKARVLRSVYSKSGVLSRDNAMGEQWKKDGLPDPFGEDYKWLDSAKKKSN